MGNIIHYFDIIRKRRNELNLTQNDLAELSGIGLRTIKEIESGSGNPTINTIIKLLNVLGLEIYIELKNK